MKSSLGRNRGQRGFGAALFTTGLLTTALVGCTESVDSDAIRTKGIYAKYEALAIGNGSTRITAALRVGGPNGTYVNLTGGDKLVATVNDNDKVLSKTGDQYRTNFSVDKADTDIRVAFVRAEDVDAPDSEVTLPAGFKLEVDEDVVERNKPVTISWAPKSTSGTQIEWRVDGDCIFMDSGKTADDGSFTLSSSQIDAKPSAEDESCEITVTVDRVATGTVDSAFGEGGEFKAIQRRSVTFTSVPVGSVKPTPSNTGSSSSAPPSTEIDAGVVIPEDASTPDSGVSAPEDAASSQPTSDAATSEPSSSDSSAADAGSADAAADAAADAN